jgi:hypothetical protein
VILKRKGKMKEVIGGTRKIEYLEDSSWLGMSVAEVFLDRRLENQESKK